MPALTVLGRAFYITQRSGATAAASGRARQAVEAGLDRAIRQVFGGNVPQVKRLAILQLKVQHLVEVAII
jgi:hypothetical protein